MAQADGRYERSDIGVGGVSVDKSLNYGRRCRKERLYNYLTTRHYNAYRNIYTLAKDHSPFLYQLNLMQNMPVHTGCINTICWNKTGEYILSGSDDSILCITKPDNLFDNTGHYVVLHKVQTKHLGNIFSAQFMPNSSDSIIVSCSSEGPVIVRDIHALNPYQGTYTFNCHSSTIFEVAVLPDDDNVFLSCGKDKTVRLFDLRCHRSCARAGTCPHPALIRNSHSITTLSVHPLNSNLLLVGRADGIGLVYDRRKLPDVSKFSREKAHLEYLAGQLHDNGSERDTLSKSVSSMFKFMHPLDGAVSQFTVPGMNEKCNFTSLCYSGNGQQVLASYSQDYVYLFNVDKSSNFELIQTLPKKNSGSNQGDMASTSSNISEHLTSTSQSSPQNQTTIRRSQRTPRIRVRGDWSDTGIYSVPMREEISDPIPVPTNFLNRMTEVAYNMSGGGARYLPYSQVITEPLESNDINNSREVEQNFINSDEESFDHPLERVANDDEHLEELEFEGHNDDDDDEFSGEDEECVDVAGDNRESATSASREKPFESSATAKRVKKKPQVSHATKMKFQNLRDNLKNKYGNIPIYHPRVCYQGHRNSRTLIKEAVFWGDDYIMSGSDDGRIMVWEKDTAKLVMSFPADNRVVNCLAPNPYYYCLASSGIDYDIKLWSTQNIKEAPLRPKQSQLEEIVRNNELMLEEAKQTITVPPHLFFRVLASFAHNNRRF